MPVTATPAPVPELGEATVPLSSFIQPAHRHYFTGRPERPSYRLRRYTFAGTPTVMPLMRAFLDTCAADQAPDYRYLFTLLGSELANNALRHSLSGHPRGHLQPPGPPPPHRAAPGLPRPGRTPDRRLLPVAHSDGRDLSTESGRGLAMVDAFATAWGDNGNAEYRTVWLYLAYDLAHSQWNTINAGDTENLAG